MSQKSCSMDDVDSQLAPSLQKAEQDLLKNQKLNALEKNLAERTSAEDLKQLGIMRGNPVNWFGS